MWLLGHQCICCNLTQKCNTFSQCGNKKDASVPLAEVADQLTTLSVTTTLYGTKERQSPTYTGLNQTSANHTQQSSDIMADMTAKQEQLSSSYRPHHRTVTQQSECVYVYVCVGMCVPYESLGQHCVCIGQTALVWSAWERWVTGSCWSYIPVKGEEEEERRKEYVRESESEEVTSQTGKRRIRHTEALCVLMI